VDGDKTNKMSRRGTEHKADNNKTGGYKSERDHGWKGSQVIWFRVVGSGKYVETEDRNGYEGMVKEECIYCRITLMHADHRHEALTGYLSLVIGMRYARNQYASQYKGKTTRYMRRYGDRKIK